MDVKNAVLEAVRKKAIGYESREVSEEYAIVDGVETLIKRKVSIKENPPDITALKMLLELSPPEESLSESEIKQEKIRLIKLLLEEENGTDKSKTSGKVRGRLVQKQSEPHAKTVESGNKERS